MKTTLRFKLTAAFLMITVIAFLLMGVFANIILEKQFQHYVIENLDQRKSGIVSTLESQYSGWGGEWSLSGLENIGVGALSDGLIVRVSDNGGTVIWDAMTHNSGFCADMMQNMATKMQTRNSDFDGGYTESSFALTSNGASIGTATIGYYGPYFYTDTDISFLNTLNKLLILGIVIGGLISLVFGAYMAKRLTDPISKVIRTAEKISGGNYACRVKEKSSTSELIELTGAINTLAETLGKQENLRKRLSADVAHELRTPIANLQSHLEAMIDGIWAPDTERLKSCHEETTRLTRIVGDLENLARYEAENMSLEKEDFDISELINNVVKCFENEFRSRGMELLTAYSEQHIHADKDKVSQILVNIISNALKYTPDGGKIEITVTGGEKDVRISVRDSGIGIAPSDLPYIFERFYRADKSRSRASGGSGIGLAIVKSLVEAHGGTITVISEISKGSEFIVLLPF